MCKEYDGYATYSKSNSGRYRGTEPKVGMRFKKKGHLLEITSVDLLSHTENSHSDYRPVGFKKKFKFKCKKVRENG